MKPTIIMKLFFSNLLILLIVILQSISCTTSSKSDIENTTQSSNTSLSDESIQPKDMPLAFRRTTLIVRDIEKSLSLYRDVIGMEVIYDNTMNRPHPDDGREQDLRLVFLKANHSFYGVLGLLEFDYKNNSKVSSTIRRDGFAEQNIVLLFNSKNLESQFEKIKELPFVEIISEPKLTQYPSYDGKDIIKVMVSKFYDPDGFLIEFNKILDDI